MPRFERQADLPVDAAELFRWHAAPGAFERLVPAFDPVTLRRRAPSLTDGTEVEFAFGPLNLMRWLARHQAVTPGESFQDIQVKGPFAAWLHTHRFVDDPAGSTLFDEIEYRLPLHPLSQWLAGWHVRQRLDRMFSYRHRRTQADMARIETLKGDRPLRIGITGASGMVGQELAGLLSVAGHTVVPLVRKNGSTPSIPGEASPLCWKPFDDSQAEGWRALDGIVHLAGATIGQRWTDDAKAAIRSSRIEASAQLIDGLERVGAKPAAFVAASAIGAYPSDASERAYTEDDPVADGFLGSIVRDWEAATSAAERLGSRVVQLRLGIVLSPSGGALERMLTPFKLGAGGPIGNGRQWQSWVALDDVAYAFANALVDDAWRGPINVVAPTPVRQKPFAKTLGSVLSRPAFMPLPATAVKVMFGEMGEMLLLEGTRVASEKIQSLGFKFAYPELKSALKHMLGK